MSEVTNLKRLTVKIDADLKRRVRIRAAEEGIGMSAYVRSLIRDELEQEPNNSGEDDGTRT